ncbi:MAG TPA: hypothetical protein VL326_20595 [Kofleriaceae bacterium]|jgi:hypothetical protein|nr:hypothetical protein [Kofleriaceae bacterium]
MSKRILLGLTLLAACAEMGPGIPDEAPSGPGKEDSPGYTVTAKHWLVVGDALTPGDTKFTATVKAPSDIKTIDLWLDGSYVKSVTGHVDFAFDVPVDSFPIGEHFVVLAERGNPHAFSEVKVTRSAPLYVAVSNDWDDPDHTDDKLERQDRLHTNHPHLVITHFVGPYTFTAPSVSAARQQVLVDWLKGYEAKGDEIGLHIHPWCNFVQAAGVTCRTTPSFAHTSDTTGYTVILGSYTQAELEKMFVKANELFVAHGLEKPTSFRAGGWTSTTEVLTAMGKTGYKVDASAANWARLEEWRYVQDASIYQWNQQHWGPVDETTQPYYPSKDDILADAAPHQSVLEVPDNGALVDYVTAQEMIDMFRVNFDGRALTQAKQYSIGYHPVDFSESFFQRIDGALTEIDKHLAVDDHGPVIYARMTDLVKAFPAP